MSELRFDGRVAIVTGAGGGLGRQHALTLAAYGAKVVVNDLGGSAHGGGQSASAADKVVEEIRALGGEAVANYDSVENGAAIVQTALDAFGTVDIVINNAGILRDVSFQKMTQDDWDLIMRVHLKGSMSVSHAAWPIMRDKGYGRIVMTTSAAGIYGNFGQANYCAAKLGILGLANCLAEEGRSKNILVNTIAPLAASRLTETVMPPDILAKLKPDAVSPLVAWLCHEQCRETKGLFEVGAGYIAKLRWERTLGHTFPVNKAFTVEDVAACWDKITDFEDATHPTTVTESFMTIMDGLNHPSLGGNEFIDLDVASTAKLELESSYDERDLALYALGIGAARDPMDKSELAYVYELGGQFQAFPTYGVMPQINAMLTLAKTGGSGLPGMNFGFDRLLHGEQYTEIKRPLPPHAKLKHTFTLKHAYDKDPNAVITFAISSKDETGEEIIYNEMTSFVKGAGGWGGDRGPSADINVPPAREPDAVIEEKTDVNQTLLYRLSGDWNPLHADPDFAKAFGYDRPILHGLCTFGYCGRHIIKSFCNNDGRYFRSIKVRFAKTVFPGETLVTKMWKESDTRIIFETSVKERNEVVIKNAVVELYTTIPSAKKAVAAPAEIPASAASTTVAAQDVRLTASDVFGVIASHVATRPELVAKVKTSFQFKINNPQSNWFLDLKNGQGSCSAGLIDQPDVTLELNESDLETVVTGTLADVQKLFFGGQLKIGGNVMASNKLTVLQEINPAHFAEAKNQRADVAATAATPASAEPTADLLTASNVFAAIQHAVAAHPEWVEKTKTVFQFKLKNPDSDWILDLKNGAGSCHAGVAESADVTLALDSDLLPVVVSSSLAEVQKLFFGGQLKISGNVMASNKLTILQQITPADFKVAQQQRVASGASHATSAQAPAKAAAAPAIFTNLQHNLAAGKFRDLGLTETFTFNLTDLARQWSIDFAIGTVSEGAAGDAAVILGITDENLHALVHGIRTARDLYQHGELRVDGDARLAHRLSFLQVAPEAAV